MRRGFEQYQRAPGISDPAQAVAPVEATQVFQPAAKKDGKQVVGKVFVTFSQFLLDRQTFMMQTEPVVNRREP